MLCQLSQSLLYYKDHLYRSSRPEMFCKKVFLKVCKIHRKTCARVSFFNKVAGLRPATLLKKRLWHRCFFCEICKIFKTTFFYRTSPVAASDLFVFAALKQFGQGCISLFFKEVSKIIETKILEKLLLPLRAC